MQMKNGARSVLDTYAIIFFTSSPWVGIFILLATFVEPFTGLTGLIGAVTAVIASRLFGFDTHQSKSGVFAFNSMLLCLGLGYFYPTGDFSVAIWLTLTISAALLTMLVYVTFNHLTLTYLGLPSMSLAFSVVAAGYCFFAIRIGESLFFQETRSLLLDWSPQLGDFFNLYFESLGSIFFQPSILAGMLVAVALLIATRIGFLLSFLGYGIAYVFFLRFTDIGLSDVLYPGLNLILIAISIGGIFLVPSITSYFFALIACFMGIVITFAFRSFFYTFYIPPFAFPFNITVMVFILAMRLRMRNKNPYVIDFGIQIPELALKHFQTRIRRFYQTGIPQFFLPFTGEWTITQGNHGEITHKQQWGYAWDFEIFDRRGNRFKTIETKLDHYYAWGRPVLASATGTVVKVVDGIPDNHIHQINTRENWGNLVVLSHGIGIYSMYCHLQKGSVRVKTGEVVHKGERLGSVGNSGRSAVPHLHFNVQIGAEPGSVTLRSFFVNYKMRKDSDSLRLKAYGIPEKEDKVSPLLPDLSLQDILHLKVGDTTSFMVECGGKKFTEKWNVTVDLWGTLTIASDRDAWLDFSIYEGIYNVLNFRGSRKTALFAFAALVSRLPFYEKEELEWDDSPPYSVFVNEFTQNLLIILSSFFPVMDFKIHSRARVDRNQIEITSRTISRLIKGKLDEYQGTAIIERFGGVSGLELFFNGNRLVKAGRIDNEDETMQPGTD